MRNLKLKLATTLAVLGLVALPVVQVGTASAACGSSIDDRTYGTHIGHNIVHKSTEGWAMRTYIGCTGTKGAREYKLAFYSNCVLDLRIYDNSGSSPKYITRSFTTHDGTIVPQTGCTLEFQTNGNMVIYNDLHDELWETGSTHTNGAYPGWIHIRVTDFSWQIYYGAFPGELLYYA